MEKLIESSKENNKFCGIAFVTFNTIKEQEDYLHQKKHSCCFRDKHEDPLNSYIKKIIFGRAPEPEDIIFENFDISFKIRFQNSICNYDALIPSISLPITFLINIFLYFYQSKIDKSSSKTNILYVFSFLITILSAINDLILK